jgi:hypothetical protein
MSILDVKLSEIDIENSVQARVRLDGNVVEEYMGLMRTGVEMAPVLLYREGDAYYIVDGFHRIDAARSMGLKKIRAEVKDGTKADAAWDALSSNTTHGLRRSNADKRRAVELALKNPRSRKMSARAIAEHVGVDHKTVAAIQKEKESVGEIPHVERREGRDGKSYQATTRAPAHPAKPPPPTDADYDEAQRQHDERHAEPEPAPPDTIDREFMAQLLEFKRWWASLGPAQREFAQSRIFGSEAA